MKHRALYVIALGTVFGLVLGGGRWASASQLAQLDIAAGTIAFYPSAGLLIAKNGVELHFGNELIQCDSAEVETASQRLTASGDVEVFDASGAESTGPAYVAELNGAGQFTAIATPPPEPKNVEPAARSSHASYIPGTSIVFSPAQVYTNGAYVTQANYVYNLNPGRLTFTMSAVPPASVDVPIEIARTGDTATDLHLRYDQYYGSGYSVEERVAASDATYAAIAYSEYLTLSRVDFVAADHLAPGLNQTLEASALTGFTYGRYDLNDTGKHGTLDFSISQSNGYQLDELDFYTPSFLLSHLLTARGEFGYAHEVHPVEVPIDSAWHDLYGFVVSSLPLRAPFGTTFTSNWSFLDGSYDYGRFRQFSDVTFSLMRAFSRKLSLSATADFTNFGDHYFTSLFVYPNYSQGIPLPDGSIYYGASAYTGTSTLRTYELLAQFNPSSLVSFTSSLAYDRDFPQYHLYGRSQYVASFGLRIPIARSRFLVIGDSIPFGSLGEHYAGTFFFQVTH